MSRFSARILFTAVACGLPELEASITQTGAETNNELRGIQQLRVYGRAGH